MSKKLPNVHAILAVDSNNGLAKDGKIPWKSKKDLQFFKTQTTTNVVIMGSKTLLSLPKGEPLPNRINIVVTNNCNKYYKMYENFENIYFVNSEQVIDLIHNAYKNKIIFVIGGNQIYNLLLPYCSTVWLTKIKSNYKCDLIFNYDLSILKKDVIYTDQELEIMRLDLEIY
jgi:dihydrofolate reductase